MLVKSTRVWIADNFMPCILEIKDTKITKIMEYSDIEVDYDFGDKRILPGFIDIHTHGAMGFDTNDANSEGLIKWLEYLPSEGVTAFCPTTVTQTEEVLIKASQNVITIRNMNPKGAKILGINFEGPYLDVNHCGAQPVPCIVKPDINQFEKFLKASDGMILIMTVAVEKDNNLEFTRQLANKGIIVSVGHSGADYNTAKLAFANGARLMTHTFNAMTPLHHRDPGQVGAAFRCRQNYAEIITDGIHSNIDILNIFYHEKGPDYAIMVSDSLCAKGCGEGEYYLGGERIYIYKDGSAHRISGNLAGSTLRIIDGLRICVNDAMIPFNYALNSCTINPAKLLRIDDRKGKICAFYDADLVIIDDDYTIIKTMVEGQFLYEKD